MESWTSTPRMGGTGLMPHPMPPRVVASHATVSRRIPILSYHQTSRTPPPGTPYRHLTLPPWRLALQLGALRALGWQGLSMQELLPYQVGHKHGKVFGITFDDGYLNNVEHALPVLRGLGFTATLYMVSAQVGGTNAWDHARGVPPSPIAGLDALQEWVRAGMEIGAHTRNHVDLGSCSDVQAYTEIAGAKADLEDALGVRVQSFCYPYGRYRATHAAMCREAGYTSATTTESARTKPGDDLMQLPRITVYLAGSATRVVLQVTTNFEDWRTARVRRRTHAAAH